MRKALGILFVFLLGSSFMYSQGLTATVVSQTDESCFGANDGALTIEVSGGNPSYSAILLGHPSGAPVAGTETPVGSGMFVWSGLPANEVTGYGIVIQDTPLPPFPFPNFQFIADIYIFTAPAISVAPVLTDETCMGLNDGSIILNPSGGTPNATPPSYTYRWGDGVTTENRTGISGGIYNVMVEDANGCTLDTSFTISDGVSLVADFTANSGCAGDALLFTDASTGIIVDYSWVFTDGTPPTDVGVGPHSVIFNSSGNKSVTLTVSDGACSDDITKDITIFTVPVVTIDPFADICGNVSPIALTGTPLGGTFTGAGVVGNTFDPSIAGVGSHTITYTVLDGNGCSGSASTTVDVISLPNVAFSALSDICESGSPITLTQGSPAGGTYTGSGVVGNTFDPASAGPGIHTITYTFSNGTCSNSATQTITVTANPTVSLTTPGPFCVNDGGVTLAGGSPVGGVYTGLGVVGNTFDPSLAGVGTHSITYTFTDGSGCIGVAVSDIVVNALPVVTIDGIADICSNVSPIALTGTPLGGTFTGAGVVGNTFDPSIAGAGSHTISHSFTDISGCSGLATTIVNVLPVPTANFAGTPDMCINGGVLTLTGGTPSGGVYSGLGVAGGGFDPVIAGLGTHILQYDFTSPGGCQGTDSDTLEVTDTTLIDFTLPSGLCSSSGIISLNPSPSGGVFTGAGIVGDDFDPSVSGIGIHTITYSFLGANGCTSVLMKNIEVYDRPTVSIGALPAVCANSAAFDLIGATPSGGIYTGTGITTSPTFDPLVAGVGSHEIVYSFTDVLGCSNSDTATLLVNSLPSVTITPDTARVCQGDTASFTVTGGVSHSWSPLINIIGENTSTPQMFPTTSTVYYDTVRNAAGCIVIDSALVEVSPNIPISVTSDQVICFSDSTLLVVTSVPGVSIQWTPNAGLSNFTNDSIWVQPSVSTTYTVLVSSAGGCSNTATVNVDVRPEVTGVITVSADTVCFGTDVTVTGVFDPGFVAHPTGGYSFDSGNTFQTINQDVISGTVPGNQSVSVVLKDEFGCLSDTLEETVVVLDQLTYNLDTITVPDCVNPNSGEFHVNTISGSKPSYTLNINGDVRSNLTGVSNEVFNNLTPGIYNILITDDFSCQVSENLTFQDAFTFDTVVNDVTCYGQSDGFISIANVSGGTPAYEFSLDGGAFSFVPLFTNLSARTYVIDIRDGSGCQVPISITINQPDSLQGVLTSLVSESCEGDNLGQVVVSSVGGVSDYTYDLNGTVLTNPSSATFDNLPAGTDTIIIRDAQFCMVAVPFTIDSGAVITTYITSIDASDCVSDDGQAILDSTVGGSGNYQYALDGVTFKDSVSIVVDLTSIAAGSYILSTRDIVSGCVSSTTFSVSFPSGLVIDSIRQVVLDESCAGADGEVDLSNFIGAPSPFNFQLHNSLNDTIIVGFQSDSSFNSLLANGYYVKIRDGLGCEYNMTPFSVNSTSISVSTSSTFATCGLSNGTISLNVVNGNSPYVFTLNDTLVQTDSVFTGLDEGIYKLDVVDASSPIACSTTVFSQVFSTRAYAQISTDSSLCSYSNEGEMRVEFLISADTSIYTYEFSVNGGLFSEDSVYSGLYPGYHTLDIKEIVKADPDSSCTYRHFETYYNVPVDTGIVDTLQVDRFIIFAPDTITRQLLAIPTQKGEDYGKIAIYGIRGGVRPYEFGLSLGNLFSYNNLDSTLNVIENLGEGQYSVFVVDSNNCEAELLIYVPADFYIPNVITPNGDGANDQFVISGLPENSRLRVYDRWGVRVFFSENYQNDWDGGVQRSGTYFFELDTPNYGTHKGWVQIIK
ncbi:gliding motility-associated C-terminal domain-containing protein [Cyclobacteriaceae bacterium]|nr:gliding motility-associated C-terminal domain-containing protein [Cyclobacteriaceae bacterium]